MLPKRITIASVLWVGGAIELLIFAVGGALALTGRPLEGIKFSLFGLLLPGVVLMTGILIAIIRRPAWFKEASSIFGALLALSSLLVVVPLLLWMPFSPTQWRIDDLPLVLRLPVISGVVLVSILAVAWIVDIVLTSWRMRDYGRFLAGLVLAGIVALVAAGAVISGMR